MVICLIGVISLFKFFFFFFFFFFKFFFKFPGIIGERDRGGVNAERLC